MKMNLALILVISLMSCSNDSAVMNRTAGFSKESAMNYDMAAPTEQALPMPNPDQDRKVIKEGSMSFKCEDVNETKLAIAKICKDLEAYSSNEGQDSYGDNLNYRQTIRVPAAKFDTLVLRLEKLAIKVESKDVSMRDVTEDYIDLDTRLKTKKELESRYREILKDARKVEEVLSVEREIANVRAEIESMEGRLNYLKDRIALSTLTVNYYQEVHSAFGFASKLMDSFRIGWENLLSFLIGIMNLWPFMILIVIGIGVFIRYKRRKA
jgi:hypothetical protein